jgi:FMN-dependent oxidoreductase (nitrilotriacetate monooxygenase family)
MTTHKQMSLSVFAAADANYHMAGWRHPDGGRRAAFDIQQWVEFAQTLERGKIDMLFIPDSPAAYGVDDPEQFTRIARNFGFEPFTLASALALKTKHLGLALTASTTWSEPYTVARMFASLDRISGGRSGWNVVTGRNPEDALNYSRDQHIEHDKRYDVAEEFLDVCTGLWNSYDADAFVLDTAQGRYLKPGAYRPLNHKGKYFSVKGPLNVPRPIQGRPVIVQAGQSSAGMDLAARVADCVFTVQPTPEDAKRYYDDLKARAAHFGRDPNTLKILPGASIYCGRTHEEAKQKFDELQALVPAAFAIKALSALLGADFSDLPPDGPIPPLKPNAMYADPELTARKARAEGMTLVQYARHMTTSKSHNIIVGDAREVADEMERWFTAGACDGFNLLPPLMPASMQDFVDLVVPELQRRGLFRTEYAGPTLRDNLGLT